MSALFADEVLRGDGFILRPLTPDDAPDITDACTDELTQQWLPLPQPYTIDTARSFIAASEPQRLSGSGIVRVIDVDGRLHGMIDLKSTDWRSRTTEIGYWIAPWGRGRGLAGRASKRLAEWALQSQGMERVEIRSATENIASQKAALTAGFVHEGTLRSAGHVHAGRVDVMIFGRVAAD